MSRESSSSAVSARLELLSTVIDRLACPACLSSLLLEQERLLCSGCGRVFPIVDGIPVLIAEQTGR